MSTNLKHVSYHLRDVEGMIRTYEKRYGTSSRDLVRGHRENEEVSIPRSDYMRWLMFIRIADEMVTDAEGQTIFADPICA